jgi:chemotaxis protein histidine kinase CheA
MMPQSRVTDMLVCVGPPDVCAMGCETVLVGMAGAGGAGAAVAGVAAMGVPVPTQPPATTTSPQPSAELQQNGTIKTSAPPGATLPPIPLSSAGYPDLPAAQTANFESVQPVDVPPATTLYRAIDNPAQAAGSYWSPDVPSVPGLLAMAQVPANGLKAWMGQAGGLANQLWAPLGSLNPTAIVQSALSGPIQQAQQAAQQAVQGAQAAANQASQAASQAEQQAQQAVQQAQQGAQQAAQQAENQAQQLANQAQQAAQSAQQQAQQAVQQAQQSVQQAQQQAQQAVGQAKAAAQQAVTQAQQQAQQVQQQAKQATQQAQQAAQQAQQAAKQAGQQAQQAGQQASQAAQGLGKGLL